MQVKEVVCCSSTLELLLSLARPERCCFSIAYTSSLDRLPVTLRAMRHPHAHSSLGRGMCVPSQGFTHIAAALTGTAGAPDSASLFSRSGADVFVGG